MRTRAHIALLLPLACLLGCGLPYTPPVSSLSGNWQIQSGTAITSPPTGFYLVGAIQGQDSQLTGVFNTVYVSGVSPTVESYSGTFNPSTGSLVLNSTAPLPAGQTIATLSVPANPSDLSSGTLNIMCGLCANGQQFQIVGVEIAPLNGTYTGTLTASPNLSGTASLTLTQSSTPNSSGQFPLTSTFSFTGSSGFNTYAISGTISGEGITLYDPTPGILPLVSLMASTNPAATQMTVSNLAFASDTVLYTGTLTLQQ
jgi:hypothetical protein